MAKEMGHSRPVRTPAPTTAIIGVVFDLEDKVNGEMNIQIQNGLQSEAARLGYTIRAHWTADERDLAQFLDGCAGILAVNIKKPAALDRVMGCGKPVVRAGWTVPLEQVDLVGGTDREAGVAVANYLYGLGHRDIVFVHGDIDLRGRRERLHGLLEVVDASADMTCHDLTSGPGTSFAAGLDRILATGAQPTAFFCGHDGLAITACSNILSRGWQIPLDVSVVGFCDFSAALQVSPALTTVKIRGQEFGRSAVRRLDTRLRHPGLALPPMRLLVPNILIERGSTGPALEKVPRR